MSEQCPSKFYVESIPLKDVSVLETRYQELMDWEVGSVEELEAWLRSEQELHNAILEAMIGHQIEFVGDTADAELFREENIPLTVREQELVAKYNEIMGGLTVEWEGETKPYPFVMPLLDNPD